VEESVPVEEKRNNAVGVPIMRVRIFSGVRGAESAADPTRREGAQIL